MTDNRSKKSPPQNPAAAELEILPDDEGLEDSSGGTGGLLGEDGFTFDGAPEPEEPAELPDGVLAGLAPGARDGGLEDIPEPFPVGSPEERVPYAGVRGPGGPYGASGRRRGPVSGPPEDLDDEDLPTFSDWGGAEEEEEDGAYASENFSGDEYEPQDEAWGDGQREAPAGFGIGADNSEDYGHLAAGPGGGSPEDSPDGVEFVSGPTALPEIGPDGGGTVLDELEGIFREMDARVSAPAAGAAPQPRYAPDGVQDGVNEEEEEFAEAPPAGAQKRELPARKPVPARTEGGDAGRTILLTDRVEEGKKPKGPRPRPGRIVSGSAHSHRDARAPEQPPFEKGAGSRAAGPPARGGSARQAPPGAAAAGRSGRGRPPDDRILPPAGKSAVSISRDVESRIPLQLKPRRDGGPSAPIPGDWPEITAHGGRGGQLKVSDLTADELSELVERAVERALSRAVSRLKN
jgi:hypothetical protein